MRRAKRTSSNQSVLLRQPDHTMNLCAFYGLFKFERRKNGRHSLGEHCFARARRTDEQYVMPACGSYFDGSFGVRLTAHLAKIVRIMIEVGQQGLSVDAQRKRRLLGVDQI